MRLIELWLIPVAAAIERVDQCVAFGGWCSSVRPHGSLSRQPPGARLTVLMNNVSGVHT